VARRASNLLGVAGAGALLVLVLCAGSARAVSLQPIGEFDQPIYVTSAPADGNRLFVVERGGKIEQVRGGAVSTFADLSTVVSCCEGERGLLSIALAPDFEASGRLYVDYTGRQEPGEIHVAELRASGDSAPLSSLRNLLTIPHPGAANHNGGQLQFGPDGHLYISTGDGGGGDDQFHNAQSRASLLGKILRIDPLPGGGQPYTIPAGNPLVGKTGRDEIWAYGLRNPWRFSFDRQGGDLLIADVGQSAREEVDYASYPALGGGANYGWNCREGKIAGPATDPECAGKPLSEFTEPIFDYPHEDEGGAFGCAIIGGYVVRDASLGDLVGRYLYGDLCAPPIRSFNPADPFSSDRSEGLEVEGLYSFGEDACARLYAVSGDGTVSRLTGAEPAACPSTSSSTPSAAVPAPQAVPGGSTTRAKTRVGIRAKARKVRRGKRAKLIVWVRPCGGHRGEPVKLIRGARRVATRRLNRSCSARFHPRIRRSSAFRAKLAADAAYLGATSRRLRIRIAHRRRHRAT
jgi:hypothetical protein